MRLFSCFLGASILFAVSSASQAGGFFGPPPFTNGSPLPTGVAGTYQATARGSGISGLLRFSYNGSGNPSVTGLNDYVFFVHGIMVKGPLQANISDDRISGTMDAPTSTGTNPTVADVQVNGGFFNAKIDKDSPFYKFAGKGVLQTFISELDFSVIPPAAKPYVGVQRKFKVQGMRTSLKD